MENEEILESSCGVSMHGECTIVKADLLGIDKLPKDANKVEPDEFGRLLVAHSESGYHHYVDADSATLYKTDNPLISFLEVEMDSHSLLKHAKPVEHKDRHKTQKFGPGLYRISIQRESTPEGWRKVTD